MTTARTDKQGPQKAILQKGPTVTGAHPQANQSHSKWLVSENDKWESAANKQEGSTGEQWFSPNLFSKGTSRNNVLDWRMMDF